MWAAGIERINLMRFMREPHRGKNITLLPRGAIIFSEDDVNDSIFFLLKGTVKLTISSAGGKEAIIGVLDGGTFVGESCVIGGFPRRSYSAVALSDVTLAQLDRRTMIHLLQTNEEVLYGFLFHLLHTVGELQEKLSSNLLYTSDKRLARILVSLARLATKPQVRRSFPRLGQEDLAEMIGITRQHVNSTLMKFKASGYIQYARGLKDLKVNSSLRGVAGLKSQ